MTTGNNLLLRRLKEKYASYSASQLDPKIQRGLFLFAVSNSCMDPLVYGMFSINFKRELVRCCCCMKSAWRREKLQRVMGTSASSTRKDQHLVNAADKLTLKSSLLNKSPSNRLSPALESSVTDNRRSGIPTPSSSSSQSTHSIDRANVNNFMKIKIRDMTDIPS